MAEFLTDAWIDALAASAREASVPTDVRVTVQQVVPDGPEGHEVTYVVELAGGSVSVRRGRTEDADVTFTQDLATARAIHRGELSAQAAFMDGRLSLSGDPRSILEHATTLAGLHDVFAAARA